LAALAAVALGAPAMAAVEAAVAWADLAGKGAKLQLARPAGRRQAASEARVMKRAVPE
jgi:hypothetical protein